MCNKQGVSALSPHLLFITLEEHVSLEQNVVNTQCVSARVHGAALARLSMLAGQEHVALEQNMVNTQRVSAHVHGAALARPSVLAGQEHIALYHGQHTRRQCTFTTLVVHYMAGTCSAVSCATHNA
jgi:hypothetical protein